MITTAERVSHRDASDNYVFQRSLLAYHEAAERVHGDVLEIGTGSGYGVDIVAPMASRFVTVDKHNADSDDPRYVRAVVPPLPFDDASFDTVISFQVVEHIRKDKDLIREIHRVLRPGGRLIISTPNIKMSLTRNPWHVREYTAAEFARLLESNFKSVERFGVFGRANVMEYYENNRRSVARMARWDVLGMRNWLPRWALKLPYDVLNRINRRRLLNSDQRLTSGIKMEDYYLAPATDECFDLFYIAAKE